MGLMGTTSISYYFVKMIFCRKIPFLNISRRLLSSEALSEHLRKAHATELFRIAFNEARNSHTSLSANDLDEMMASQKTRPSVLLDSYQVLGFAFGKLSYFTPDSCGRILSRVVDESAVRQFNDSIRKIQQNDSSNDLEDLKETLKYHRSIRISANYEDNSDSSVNQLELAAAEALHQLLALSQKF
jgi:demethoxyubiquinone hydroxylase (CLK1/Coq7/Cat5 family)